jgi:hypothetical protein
MPCSRAAAAAHLGLTLRTLARYEATESAPRAVLVACFAESHYGRSAIACDVARDADTQRGLARALRDREAHYRRTIDALERENAAAARSGTGAANGPIFNVG